MEVAFFYCCEEPSTIHTRIEFAFFAKTSSYLHNSILKGHMF